MKYLPNWTINMTLIWHNWSLKNSPELTILIRVHSYSLPFEVFYQGKSPTGSRKFYLTSPKAEYLLFSKLFGLFCMGEYFCMGDSSFLFHLPIESFISVWIHGDLFYTVITPNYFILLQKIFQCWATGYYFIWFLCPFDISLSLCFFTSFLNCIFIGYWVLA